MSAATSQGARRVRALFFDIGNVLVRFDARTLAARFAWQLRRRPIKVAELLLSSGWLDALERGRLSPGGFFRRLRDDAGFPDDYDLFRSMWCGHFRLEPLAARLLARASRRAPVYLLSNTNRLHYDFIRRRYAFVGRAEGAVLSYRLGLRKPEPAIYKAALRMAKIPPEAAFFVDDIEENVAAARKLGIEAWRHRGPQALERRLEELGLL